MEIEHRFLDDLVPVLLTVPQIVENTNRPCLLIGELDARMLLTSLHRGLHADGHSLFLSKMALSPFASNAAFNSISKLC